MGGVWLCNPMVGEILGDYNSARMPDFGVEAFRL